LPIWIGVGEGTHTLRWEYDDHQYYSSTVYVDAISFAPLLEFTTPVGGEVWDIGSLQTMTWDHTMAAGATVALEYSRDGGISWLMIHPAAPNSGSYEWVIPPTPSTNALLRITGSRCGSDQTTVPLTIRGVYQRLELDAGIPLIVFGPGEHEGYTFTPGERYAVVFPPSAVRILQD
jgi:hypothetical protein